MDRVALELGSFSIHWYGVLVALGFWIGLWNASRRARNEGIAPERIWDAGVWLILGTIIGARTLYVTTYWERGFAGKPLSEIFMVHHGGLVYYGGLIGASLALLAYLLVKKLPVWQFADVFAPSVALGYVFGRLGCLMNGCCFGRQTACPWGIQFPAEHETAGRPVHPTQLYDSFLNLLLYVFLAWLYRRKKFDGQVFAAYLVGYAVLRSLVELFRGDYPRYFAGWLTPAHLISLGILIVGAILWLLLRSTPRHA